MTDAEITEFDYQSECHCSKTCYDPRRNGNRLITSQNVTAPKLVLSIVRTGCGLITSQNVTAPKPVVANPIEWDGLITSQNVTAPKQGSSTMEVNTV